MGDRGAQDFSVLLQASKKREVLVHMLGIFPSLTMAAPKVGLQSTLKVTGTFY